MDPLRKLLIVGVNHRRASPPVRERLFMGEPDQARLLSSIRDLGIAEAVLISTCERVEVLAADTNPQSAMDGLIGLMSRWTRISPSEMREQCHRHAGMNALRHLFALTCSLESRVVGEPEVLGQVKASHGLAMALGTAGPEVEAALQAAYAVAKRVRSETSVAERPVSIAAAMIRVARNLHGSLRRCTALLVGLGEMVELMAWQLKDMGIRDLVAVHPSRHRAESAARSLLGHYREWDELMEALVQADVVIAGMGSGRYTITAPDVAVALKRRRGRPILFIDTAIPRDIDPAVDELEAAFVYDLDDLEGIARQGRVNREAAADTAWAIVVDELTAYMRRCAERSAVPTIVSLRQHFESVRRQVVADVKHDVEAATRLLVNRLLHGPSEALREAAAMGVTEGEELERAVDRLFRVQSRRRHEEEASGGKKSL